MTAATTPSPPNAGEWPWPLRQSPISPNAPLELQFLPPLSSSTDTGACPRPPRESPWTVDPSRLQKLMMGTSATSASSCAAIGEGVTKAGGPSLLPSPIPAGPASTGDLGAFFDPGINKPLPSGWERCLDLKSGEVFIKKKSEVVAKRDLGPSCVQVGGAQFNHCKDWKQPCVGPASVPLREAVQEKRSSHNWIGGRSRMTLPMQPPAVNAIGRTYLEGGAKSHINEEGSLSERKSLCLDLDLSLTSMNRSRLTSEAQDMASLNSSTQVAASTSTSTATLGVHKSSWKWQTSTMTRNVKAISIQEMIRESTMATAVCSKCLMYVLLKKSNPTCPRCLNPIILNCSPQQSSLQKRLRLELPPEELSLSTDYFR